MDDAVNQEGSLVFVFANPDATGLVYLLRRRYFFSILRYLCLRIFLRRFLTNDPMRSLLLRLDES